MQSQCKSPKKPTSALGLMGAVLLPAVLFTVAGCGPEEVPYVPKPAYAGEKASLPGVASVPKKTIKEGDAYTVWGASYYLRSRVHHKDVEGKDMKITGYIVKTTLPEAPKCAVHETGKADPEGCVAPIPAFWVGDTKDAPLTECVKIMGWASNYAQLYDAIKEFKKRAAKKVKSKKDEEPVSDAFWGVKIPDPLPVAGAKVTVKGSYGTTFTKATSGAEADPIMGLLTFEDITYIEPPTEKASLPGMKP
jgi:hypothetical protein